MIIPENLNGFGKELRKFCIDSGITPEVIAKATNVDVATLLVYETTGAPTVDFVITLSTWVTEQGWDFHRYGNILYQKAMDEINSITISTMVDGTYTHAAVVFSQCLDAGGTSFIDDFLSSAAVKNHRPKT